MEYINDIDELKKMNTFGLKEICRYNRDIFSSFNKLNRKELIEWFNEILNNNTKIRKPPYIDETFLKQRKDYIYKS
jgi:hypothetical protein